MEYAKRIPIRENSRNSWLKKTLSKKDKTLAINTGQKKPIVIYILNLGYFEFPSVTASYLWLSRVTTITFAFFYLS